MAADATATGGAGGDGDSVSSRRSSGADRVVVVSRKVPAKTVTKDAARGARFPVTRVETRLAVAGPVRTAVVGTGWGARVAVPALRAGGLVVTALVGRTADKAEAEAKRLGIGFATDDIADVLQRDDVDLVYVSTPPRTHEPYSSMILKAGLHCLCEKPLALTVDEADTLCTAAAAARSRRRVALVDHELRFLPVMQHMRELVKSGACGKVCRVDARNKMGRFVDPTSPHHWWFERSQGGGALGSLGSHLFDLITFVTDLECTHVSCLLTSLTTRRPRPEGGSGEVTAEESADVQLRFTKGAVGSISCSMIEPDSAEHGLRIAIVGTKATISYRNGTLTRYTHARAPRVAVGATGSGEEPAPQSGFVETIDEFRPVVSHGVLSTEWGTGMVLYAQALRAALEYGDVRGDWLADAASFEDGARVQRFLDAAITSANTLRWTKL